MKIDINSIQREFLLYDDRFLLFYPEIRESNKNKFQEYMVIVWVSKFVKNIEKSMTVDEFKNKRKICPDDGLISKLIREDDIESFQTYLSKTNYDIYSRIPPSIFESDLSLNKSPTLIEYSAFFGSVNIFKFLFIRIGQDFFKEKEKLKSLYYYSISGGCFEIIHLVEEVNPKIDLFDKHCIKLSIYYHQNDIAEYIHENSGIQYDLDDLVYCIKCNNYEMFEIIFENENINNLIENGLKNHSSTDIQKLLLISLQVGNLIFFKFFLVEFGFDVNTKLDANSNSFLFIHLIILFSNGIFFFRVFYATLLHTAVEYRKKDIVEFLLTIKEIDKNILNLISLHIL